MQFSFQQKAGPLPKKAVEPGAKQQQPQTCLRSPLIAIDAGLKGGIS
jgi:hypothetical protein